MKEPRVQLQDSKIWRLKHFWTILMFFCTFELKYFNQSGVLVFTDWDCVP